MAGSDFFTGNVAGEDPRVAQARSAAAGSPFLVALASSLQNAQQFGNDRRARLVGAGIGFLQGLIAGQQRQTAADLTARDINLQEQFVSGLQQKFAGETSYMAANGSLLDQERLKERQQTFASLVPLLNSSDPAVRSQAFSQIGQLSEKDAAHFSELDARSETQRQERYALRQKQGDAYAREFNSLQDEQRRKEDEWNEVASILADPKADLQAKRAAYFKYSQTSYGDAIGSDGTHISASPLGVGFSFDLLKDMTPEEMFAAASDAHMARTQQLTPRLNALVGSMQRDGFQFNSENGGVDDLNLIRDQELRKQYTPTSTLQPPAAPGRQRAPLQGVVEDVLGQLKQGPDSYVEYPLGDINNPNSPRGQSALTQFKNFIRRPTNE